MGSFLGELFLPSILLNGGKGEKEKRRKGEKEKRRKGEKETRRQGDKETRKKIRRK
jgi:hypothetical protein